MREILFRGKVKNTNEWQYGDLRHWTKKSVGIHHQELHTTLRVIPETVGQYTGLTDKNGNNIFEGDIVRCKYANTPKNEHIQKVVFYEGKFMAEFSRGGCYAALYYGERHLNFDKSVYMTEIEVIGNIHDNPELLKGGETDV